MDCIRINADRCRKSCRDGTAISSDEHGLDAEPAQLGDQVTRIGSDFIDEIDDPDESIPLEQDRAGPFAFELVWRCDLYGLERSTCKETSHKLTAKVSNKRL